MTRIPGGIPGQGSFEPPTLGEEIVAAIGADDIVRAARLLREADSIGQPGLGMLADLLDGDAKADPELPQQYPYRLKTASWGNAGRKPKGSRSKAKSNSSYKRKLSPRTSDPMLCSMVRRRIEAGATRDDAIQAVATAEKVSPSLVGKAFDAYRHKTKISRLRD